MVGFRQNGPDESVLSLTSKMVKDGGCCDNPRKSMNGMCESCGSAYREGQDAYQVKVQLPNNINFRDPSVKNHLRQVVPDDWSDFSVRLEKADRDSSDKRNTYQLRLLRRNVPQMNDQVRNPAYAIANKHIVAKSFILPSLVKIADSLDIYGETKFANIIDKMFKDAIDKSEMHDDEIGMGH